ncbi:hypothetical protein ACFWAT_14310 [Streptomyces syringium]|uniref:hypothetical protein n=1 Tax=Streptomyces syringium TaxID=76729 RepID=UPI0036477C3B
MAAIPLDLLDRIRELERQVRELAGRSQMRPAMNQVQKGNVAIGEGGQFAVWTPDQKAAIFGVGYWGGTEYGLAMRRQDGSLAMTIRNGTEENIPQPVRFFDARGTVVWADDVRTGGIAYPWLGLLPPQNSNPGASWPKTDSTEFVNIANSYNSIWQPKIRMFMHTAVDGGTGGEVRVLVNDQVWGPAVRAGESFDHTGFTGAGTEPGSVVKIVVEARRTSGNGSVYAQTKMLYGCQT